MREDLIYSNNKWAEKVIREITSITITISNIKYQAHLTMKNDVLNGFLELFSSMLFNTFAKMYIRERGLNIFLLDFFCVLVPT